MAQPEMCASSFKSWEDIALMPLLLIEWFCDIWIPDNIADESLSNNWSCPENLICIFFRLIIIVGRTLICDWCRGPWSCLGDNLREAADGYQTWEMMSVFPLCTKNDTWVKAKKLEVASGCWNGQGSGMQTHNTDLSSKVLEQCWPMSPGAPKSGSGSPIYRPCWQAVVNTSWAGVISRLWP